MESGMLVVLCNDIVALLITISGNLFVMPTYDDLQVPWGPLVLTRILSEYALILGQFSKGKATL